MTAASEMAGYFTCTCYAAEKPLLLRHTTLTVTFCMRTYLVAVNCN